MSANFIYAAGIRLLRTSADRPPGAVTPAERRMRLTAELVSRAVGDAAEPGTKAWQFSPTDAEYDSIAHALLARRPPGGDVWVFAYGSLIWKPACEIAEERVAVARGWHRAVCLGWDRHFRGSSERPGLMLALDHGGMCTGVAQRLPADAIEGNLDRLLRREIVCTPSPFPPRWITVATTGGPVRAIAFAMDRRSPAYIRGLSADEIADVLAVAAGQWGSMAEYLHNTVSHLERRGIADRFLWRMQELVAERIEAASAQRFRPVASHQQAFCNPQP